MIESDDYWFWQRYDDMYFAIHGKIPDDKDDDGSPQEVLAWHS